jgi:uncharacterized membrane protein
MYEFLKALHIVGVVVLLGNVTVTSFWKVFADRARDPRLIAHAQFMVVITDFAFTLTGILLLCIGGFGAAWLAGMDVLRDRWLVESEALFVLSGGIWLFRLVPLQMAQLRRARAFREGEPVPEAYWRDSRRWLVWGLLATLPLVGALWIMVAKG